MKMFSILLIRKQPKENSEQHDYDNFCISTELQNKVFKQSVCNFSLELESHTTSMQFDVLYQTQGTVLSGYTNTEKRVENMTHSRVFWMKFGCLGANETLSIVFDISSQTKQKLRSKRRSKIIKIYAN